MNTTATHQTDARTYLRMLWRRKWLLLAIVVALPAGAYAYSAQQAKVYQASVVLQVQAPAVDTSLFSGEGVTSPQAVNIAARLIQTTAVAQEAAKKLEPRPADPRSLLGQITATPDLDSGFVTITSSAPSGARAADLANAFGDAVVVQRAKQAVQRLNKTIADVTSQLASLGQRDRDGRRQLSQQLQRLRALRAAQGSNAEIIEPAVAPTAASAPRPRRTATLALIIGLLLGLGAVVLAERLDRRLRDPDEIEDLTGMPVLSMIPQSAFSDENRSPFAHEEAFQQLRASLMFFNIDRPLSSVLVTSPASRDGKTTVATKLAVTFARAGKDVILVDADLRRPQIAARIQIQATDGLGAALVSDRPLDSLLVDVEVDAPGAGRLQVLPAGAPPPNPSELIASSRMRSVLAQLHEKADIVIVDTPPVLAVSDPIPLLKQVSGIVVVVKMNSSTRDAVTRLQRVIANAEGFMLGIVATNVVRGLRGYGYGYGYGYGDTPPSANGDRDVVGSSRGPRAATPDRRERSAGGA